METDLRYEEGEKRGKEIGKQETKIQMIINLSKSGMENEKIAQISEVSVEFVDAILKKNK